MRRLLALAARRPRLVIVLLAALAAGGLAAGLLLPVDARVDRLAPRGSDAAHAIEVERRSFGADTAIVVVRSPDIMKTLRSGDLVVLAGLEGCLAGVPNPDAAGPCKRLRDLGGVERVQGPGLFANGSLAQIQDAVAARMQEARDRAEAAREQAVATAEKAGRSKKQAEAEGDEAATARFLTEYQAALEFASELGLTADTSLQDPEFLKNLFFAQGRDGKHGPKRRLAWLVPNRRTALIQVQLRGDLSAGKRNEVLGAIADSVGHDAFRLSTGATLALTGIAPVSQELGAAIRRSLLALTVAALVMIAGVLLLARRLRRRLLPAFVGAAVVGAAMLGFAALGRSIPLAAVVALPVLVGVAVDQAVQAQLRLQRRLDAGALRTLVIAGLAAAASALALIASPFGLVRSVGVAVAAAILLAIVFAAAAAAAVRGRPAPSARGVAVRGALRDADELVASSRPVTTLRAGGRRITAAASQLTTRASVVLLAGAVLLAGGGAVAGSGGEVQTGITDLVPESSSGAQQLEALRRQAGLAGQITLVAETANIGDPHLWRFLIKTQRAVIGETTGRCDGERLCVPLPLDELFGTAGQERLPTDGQIAGRLAALPETISRSFIDPDRGVVALPFGVGTLDGDRQREQVERLRGLAGGAPRGVRVSVGGVPAVAAAGADALESPGRRLLLAALALLFPALVLLAARRPRRRVLIALVPPALAIGWSELVLWALGIPRSPLTAALGVLVAAIAVEFSVLLAERFAALRAVGVDRVRAIDATLRDTGAAIVVSAGATIAGFAVLTFASIPMIAEFGLVTAIDLALVLVALVVVAPATWVLGDRRQVSSQTDG